MEIKKESKRKVKKAINYLTLVALVFSALQSVRMVSAWTEPTTNPPGGNIGAPINEGSATQTKSGYLNISGGGTYGTGGIGIGNQSLNSSGPWLYVGDAAGSVYGGQGLAAHNIWANGYSYGSQFVDANNGDYKVDPYGNSKLFNLDLDGGFYGHGSFSVSAGDGMALLSSIGLGGYFKNTGGLYAENNSGYYTYLGYPSSSWGVYTNGNSYTAGQVRGDGGFCIGGSCITSWPTVANSINWDSWQYGNHYASNGNIYMAWAGDWISNILGSKLSLNNWQGNHYSGSDGAEYAAIFYDANNSGYYLDPNGASQVSTIYANSWFRAQGDSGFYFQDHGGGWNMTDNTWIRAYGAGNVYAPGEMQATTVRANTQFCIGASCINSWPVSSGGTITGGGTTNYIPKLTSGTAIGNSQIFDNGTNVGIGTVNPLSKLSVGGNGTAAAAISGMGTTVGLNGSGSVYGILANSPNGYGMYGTSTSNYGIYGYSFSSAGGYFTSNSGPSLITGTGNVGIGTGTPISMLDIKNSGTTGSVVALTIRDSNGDPAFEIRPNWALNKNTIIGLNAGKSLTGSNNTIMGYGAMESESAGTLNTAIGSTALHSNTTGQYNAANGAEALYANTSGGGNSAFGRGTLLYNTTGYSNTAIGQLALSTNTTGYGNTAIGSGANISDIGISNSIAIGYNAIVNASNKVRIGNGYITRIEGQVGWSIGSDARLKHDIQDTDLGLDFINKLRPVSYKLNDGDGGTDYGFIAQEVESAIGKPTNIVMTDNSPEKMKTMRYDDLISPMVKAIQQQQEQIDELKTQIEVLRNNQ